MTWTHYRLVFRLESPLHIGWRKTGNLMQTRGYVPGKVLWAALTVRLVEAFLGKANDSRVYRQVGETLTKCFRFGYLWPAAGTWNEHRWDPPTRPHFPWDPGPEPWDYLYLNGAARTALEPIEHIAAEGMLHQIEYIAPYTREGKPVYLVGDLWVREEVQACCETAKAKDPNNALCGNIASKWQQALSILQIGGERGYGWGRGRLVQCKKTCQQHSTTPCTNSVHEDNQDDSSEDTCQLSWGEPWVWKACSDQVLVGLNCQPSAQKSVPIPVHVLVENTTHASLDIQGPIEPWLGWEHRKGRYTLSNALVMYTPGAHLTAARTLFLHPWGYLTPKAP